MSLPPEVERPLWIPLSGKLLLCPFEAPWRPLTTEEMTLLGLALVQQHHLGRYAGYEVLAAETAGDFSLKEIIEDKAGNRYVWQGLRSQLGLIEESLFALAGRALQVALWHSDHRFCGRCGRPTEELTTERAKICHHCELRFYPRLSPCVITLVTRGDSCLLARHARSSQPVFSCLAGFVEVGETPEDTVHREVHEEVGVRIQHLSYFGSQPWPFPGQLMLGFRAEYHSGEVCVDGEEILEADWFPVDKLPQIPPIATLSGQMIADFVRQQSGGGSEIS